MAIVYNTELAGGLVLGTTEHVLVGQNGLISGTSGIAFMTSPDYNSLPVAGIITATNYGVSLNQND